jgi:hypothetical protein
VKRIGAVVLLLVASGLAGGGQELALPNRPASLKFAAIGDNGTGDPPEYDIGRQMAAYHSRFPFELVIMLGDNLLAGDEHVLLSGWPIVCAIDGGIAYVLVRVLVGRGERRPSLS